MREPRKSICLIASIFDCRSPPTFCIVDLISSPRVCTGSTRPDTQHAQQFESKIVTQSVLRCSLERDRQNRLSVQRNSEWHAWQNLLLQNLWLERERLTSFVGLLGAGSVPLCLPYTTKRQACVTPIFPLLLVLLHPCIAVQQRAQRVWWLRLSTEEQHRSSQRQRNKSREELQEAHTGQS